jgi:RNA methyltransferase, TrmH family
MITKSEIKEIKSLHLPKFRQMYNKFIAEGEKTCLDLIRSGRFRPDSIYLTHDAISAAVKIEKKLEHLIKPVSNTQMEQMTALRSASPWLCVFEKNVLSLHSDLKLLNRVIFLDKIQDPGNMGTIIRIADWFGIDLVVRSEESADFFSPKVVQSTMGSLGAVHLATASLEDLVRFYQLPVLGTFMNGTAIYETKIPESCILVIGNEGNGIQVENEIFITQRISIPGNEKRSADSLNAAVATGILCSYWNRPL